MRGLFVPAFIGPHFLRAFLRPGFLGLAELRSGFLGLAELTPGNANVWQALEQV